MSRKRKPIPVFRNEAEERAFWERHGSTDYVDWNTAEPVRSGNLKPSADRLTVIPVNAPATDGPLSPTLSHQGRGGRTGRAGRLTPPLSLWLISFLVIFPLGGEDESPPPDFIQGRGSP